MKLLLLLLLLPAIAFSECRSSAVVREFNKMNGHPRGYPGHVVDHICALAVGGLDIVENMQYQTIADGKVKDKVERTPYGKKKWCNETNSKPERTVFNCD